MPKNNQKCKGYEVFQRLNYLFQIKDVMYKNSTVSTYYGNLFTNIAKKSVLKIHPQMKRQICKKCKGVLLPGKTVNITIRRVHKRPLMEYKCSQCEFIKKYPINKDKILWTERPEATVGVIDLDKSKSSKIVNKNTKKC